MDHTINGWCVYFCCLPFMFLCELDALWMCRVCTIFDDAPAKWKFTRNGNGNRLITYTAQVYVRDDDVNNRFTYQFLRKYPVKLLQWLGERLEIFISLQWQSRPCHRADECRTGNLAYIWMWAHFYIIAELCLPKYENSSCRLVNHRKCRTICLLW